MRTFLLAFICTLSLSYSPAQQSETGTNPFFTEYTTPFKTPPFQLIKFEHYMPAFMKGMEVQKKEIDAIAKVLAHVAEVDPPAPTLATMGSCPDCGGTVEHEGGCLVCRSCGFSRCS